MPCSLKISPNLLHQKRSRTHIFSLTWSKHLAGAHNIRARWDRPPPVPTLHIWRPFPMQLDFWIALVCPIRPSKPSPMRPSSAKRRKPAADAQPSTRQPTPPHDHAPQNGFSGSTPEARHRALLAAPRAGQADLLRSAMNPSRAGTMRPAALLPPAALLALPELSRRPLVSFASAASTV
jgi:hypothetical protein